MIYGMVNIEVQELVEDLEGNTQVQLMQPRAQSGDLANDMTHQAQGEWSNGQGQRQTRLQRPGAEFMATTFICRFEKGWSVYLAQQ